MRPGTYVRFCHTLQASLAGTPDMIGSGDQLAGVVPRLPPDTTTNFYYQLGKMIKTSREYSKLPLFGGVNTCIFPSHPVFIFLSCHLILSRLSPPNLIH